MSNPLVRMKVGFGRWARIAWYAGLRVRCPCCGWRGRRFPRGELAGAKCPGCHTNERLRNAWVYLRDYTPLLTAPLRLLHVAPEPVIQRRLRGCPNLHYLSADLESPRAEKHFDLTAIPYPDASFDVIICMHVLEHIPDDRAAMREMRRVLTPEGWALLQVPIGRGRETTFEDWSVVTPEDRTRVFGQCDHVRIYGHDYVDRLREARFAVEIDPAIRNLPVHVHRRHGLKPEDMYICRPDGALERDGARETGAAGSDARRNVALRRD